MKVPEILNLWRGFLLGKISSLIIMMVIVLVTKSDIPGLVIFLMWLCCALAGMLFEDIIRNGKRED